MATHDVLLNNNSRISVISALDKFTAHIKHLEKNDAKEVVRDDLKCTIRRIECDIQIKRIEQVLDNFVNQIKVAVCLPYMLENQLVVIMYFSQIDYHSIEDLINFVQIDANDSTDEKLLNRDRILNILLSPGLFKKIPNFIDKIESTCKIFVKDIEELQRITMNRINMTSSEEMSKDKVMQDIKRNTNKLALRISELESALKDGEEKLEKDTVDKKTLIQKLEAQIDELETSSNVEINKQIVESNALMNAIMSEGQSKITKLKTDLNTSKTEYQALVKSNIELEQSVHEIKAKSQQQLKTSLNNYDRDVGQRTEELERLTNLLEEREREFEIWFVEYTRQECEYFKLKSEREAEEKHLQQERVIMFVMNRSAITIQRAWRRVMAKKKKQKKKGKKGKK